MAEARDYELTTLPGGERVISERIESVRSVALGIWIGAGSRDEPPAKAGVSHFIEHLLFRGSSRYTAQEIAEIFDTMGGELNAATSRETTLLYTRIPDDHLEQALDLMTDMVFAPTFADLDAEREVVLEEIAMLDDSPQELVHDLASEALFGAHPLGRPVIGRAEVIRSIGRRSLLTHHKAAYGSENVVLAAAGNVDHARLTESFAARRDGARSPFGLTRRPVGRLASPGLRFLSKDTEQYHLCLSARHHARRRTPLRGRDPRCDPRRLRVLAALPGDPREARDGVFGVHVRQPVPRHGPGWALCGDTRGEPRECVEVASQELLDVGTGNVRPGELERAKENIKGRLLLSLESTSSRMTRLGKGLVTDTELISIDETVRRLEAVTADDVAALAAELYAPERLSAAGIGPNEERFREAVGRVNPGLLARAA